MRTPVRRLGVLGFSACLALIFAGLHLWAVNIDPLRELETTVFDRQLRLRGEKPPGPEIAIVVVDEPTVTALGRWPLSRQRYAELVDVLWRAGARVVAFDILFTEPETALPGDVADLVEATATRLGNAELSALAEQLRRRSIDADAAFAAAIAAHGRVVLPFTFQFGSTATAETAPPPPRIAYEKVRAGRAETLLPLQPTGLLAPVPVLANAAAGLGHAVLAFDVDGAPRFDYPVLEHDLEFLPSLAVRIVQLFRGVPWSDVTVELGHGVAIGPTFVPTDGAMRLPVNYRGPSKTYPTYSFLDVLRGDVKPDALRDRIVLVGAQLFGTRDMVQTPFTSVLAGVERLATIVDSMLHQDYLRRPSGAPLAEALAIVAAAFAVGIAVAHLSAVYSALVALGVVALMAVGGHLLLVHGGLWFFIVLPGSAVAAIYVLVALYRHGLLDREHRQVRTAFARYLAPKMIERLLAHPDRLKLGGELRELSIMFCDLRGSTALGERLEPEQLTRVLNDVLTPLSDIVLEHNGTIDKYTGDGLMAFWNAPVDESRHAELACRAALAMQAAMPAINAGLGEILHEPLRIGIAVNTGSCVVGNVGSRRRFDYSAMGDAVNISARLQEESKRYGIPVVIGGSTAAQVESLATLPIDEVRLRGRAGNVGLHALLGDENLRQSAPFARLRAAHTTLVDGIRLGDARAVDAALEDLRRDGTEAASIVLRAYSGRLSALHAGTLVAPRIVSARA